MYLKKEETTTYKGVAILAIVLCHFVGVYGQGITVFTPLGGMGVAIFLTLSAYGLNESWNSSCRVKSGDVQPYRFWWRKRVIAVWIPYIVVQLLAYWPFHSFQALQFILDLSFIKPLYINGWYLQYLFLWYAVFYVVRRINFFDNHKIVIFALVSGILFFTLREIKAEQSLSFLMGILLSEKKDLQEKLFKIRCGAGLLVSGLFFLGIKQFPAVRSGSKILLNAVQLGIKLPLGVGMIILTYHVMKKIKLKMITGIGMVSYELYLIHGYVLQAVPLNKTGAVIFITATASITVVFWWLMKRLEPIWYILFKVTE